MPSTDDRIVRMQFDNAEFERRIASTLTSLSNLDKALVLPNAAKGLSGLNAAAGQVDLSGISAGVDNISSKFGVMGAIGFTAIQSLTQSALSFFSTVAGKITDPIFEGGLTRSLAIEQAQFAFRGLGIDVTAAMDSARSAVLGTAYGLGDAAKAAAQFAASGIPVGEKMTSALRGVAGAAAMTGAQFSDIAYIYQGIAGANKVNSMDLMQFSTRGLNVAAAIAKTMGISEQAVRDMVSSGQMDFKTFSDAMDQAFGAHAQSANETFTGSLANMKAALSRLGASFISPQLVNFRDIFNALTPVIDDFTKSVKPLIDVFSFISSQNYTKGIVSAINGISFQALSASMPNIVDGMVGILRVIEQIGSIAKTAFKEIFPGSLSVTIIEVATWFKTFAENLQLTADGASKLHSIFSGFFAVLSIGWEIIKQGTLFLVNLGKSIASIFGPGVTGALAKFGDFFTNIQQSLVAGGGIKSFFDGLTDALQKPLEWLQKVKDAISNLFSGWSKGAADGVSGAADVLGDKFQALKERLGEVWTPFLNALEGVASAIQRAGQVIGNWLKGLWAQLAAGISSEEFNNILDALNTTLLGAIAAFMAKFLKGGINFKFLNIGGTLQQLTNSLAAMQGKIKAETLMKIAEAIAILTASVLVLSLIDSEALTKALTAMSIGFAQLMGAFAILNKISMDPKSALSFNMVATGMILLAGALLVLSLAVKVLSTMNWNELAKGLGGTVVLLAALVVASKPLSANSKGMIEAGIGIQAMAVGLLIMSAAVKIMGSMSWEELAKGLIGLVASLTAVTVAMRLMPTDVAMVRAGIGILAISVATAVLAASVAIFASMNWESMGKGLTGLAVSLGAVVLAMNLMPKDMGTAAASLVLVSGAIIGMAVAMKMISGLSWEEIAKGLTGIAVSMGLMVGASLLMQGAIPGAGAMILVAGALLIMSVALEKVGKMSWEEVIRGLIGLAAGLLLIAVASVAASSAIPMIAALGAALILLGAGIALIGVGALLLAEAFKIISSATQSAIENLPKVLEAIGKSIPSLLKGIAEGLVEMIQVFTDAAPAIMKALSIFLVYLIDTLIKLTPKLMELLSALIEGMIKLIYKYSGPLVAAGMHIIISFLQGISDNIEQIVGIVADIITKFLDAMANETPRVVSSLVNTISVFFTETARGLGELVPVILVGVGIAFIQGFIDGMSQQLSGPVMSFVTGIPGAVISWIGDALTWLWQKGVDALTGLLNGIGAGALAVWGWFGALPGAILSFFGNAIGWLLQAGADILTGLYNGLQSIWGSVIGWVSGLGGDLQGLFGGAIGWLWSAGVDIVQGLWDGIQSIWDDIKSWLEDKVGDLIDTITHPWKIFSPSHLMRDLGVNIMKGWLVGFQDGYQPVDTFFTNVSAQTTDYADNLVSGMLAPISDVARKLSDFPEFQPTITPVLDLTRVIEDSGKIGDYINDQKVAASISFNNAQLIASSQTDSQNGSQSDTTAPREIRFEQTINAPTQLSAADIYKQTRNQITIAKEELSIP